MIYYNSSDMHVSSWQLEGRRKEGIMGWRQHSQHPRKSCFSNTSHSANSLVEIHVGRWRVTPIHQVSTVKQLHTRAPTSIQRENIKQRERERGGARRDTAETVLEGRKKDRKQQSWEKLLCSPHSQRGPFSRLQTEGKKRSTYHLLLSSQPQGWSSDWLSLTDH